MQAPQFFVGAVAESQFGTGCPSLGVVRGEKFERIADEAVKVLLDGLIRVQPLHGDPLISGETTAQLEAQKIPCDPRMKNEGMKVGNKQGDVSLGRRTQFRKRPPFVPLKRMSGEQVVHFHTPNELDAAFPLQRPCQSGEGVVDHLLRMRDAKIGGPENDREEAHFTAAKTRRCRSGFAANRRPIEVLAVVASGAAAAAARQAQGHAQCAILCIAARRRFRQSEQSPSFKFLVAPMEGVDLPASMHLFHPPVFGQGVALPQLFTQPRQGPTRGGHRLSPLSIPTPLLADGRALVLIVVH